MAYLSKLVPQNLCDFGVHLPPYYGGVILVGFGSYALNFFLISRVVKARREIDFPVWA